MLSGSSMKNKSNTEATQPNQARAAGATKSARAPKADKRSLELLKTLTAMNDAGDYDAVSATIDATDKSLVTPEIEFELVRAFLGRFGTDATPTIVQAREGYKAMLAQHAERYGENALWLLLMGLLYESSENQAGLAADYLRLALEHYPDNPLFMSKEAVLERFERASESLTNPHTASKPFAALAAEFWAQVEAQLDAWCAVLKLDPIDPVLVDKIEDELNVALAAVVPEAYLVVLPALGKKPPVLQFMIDGSHGKALVLKALIERAPKNVAKHLHPLLGRERDPEAQMEVNGKTLTARDVMVYRAQAGKNFALALYAPMLEEDLKHEPQYACWAMEELCRQCLGDKLIRGAVSSIDVLLKPLAGEEALSLPALADAIERERADLAEKTLTDVLTDRVSYTADPLLNFINWRSDVSVGVSTTPELLEGYAADIPHEFDLLAKCGVAAASLIVAANDVPEEGLDGVHRLEQALMSAVPKKTRDAFSISGIARGSLFCYLDLLLWDAPRAMPALVAALKKCGIRAAMYAPLRANASFMYLVGTPLVLKERMAANAKKAANKGEARHA